MNRVLVAAMALLLLIGLATLAIVVIPWAIKAGARAFKTKSINKSKETDEAP